MRHGADDRLMTSEIEIPAYRPGRAARMEGGTRRLLLIAGGLGAALLAIIGVWALAGQRPGPAPLIAAETGPLKVKPEHAGGMQVAGADEAILSGSGHDSGEEGATSGGPPLAPASEKPAPEMLRQMQPEPPSGQTAAPAIPAPAPKAAAAAKPPVLHEAALHPAAVPAVAAKTGAMHGVAVQLAALPSEEAARQEWERLSKKFPALLASRQPLITRVSHAGHEFWRLRASGFTDGAEARRLCERLRARGAGCALADF